MINRRKVRTTSSHHGLYGLGYTRITMITTIDSNSGNWSKLNKGSLSADYCLKFDSMKEESLVIAK
jgi:hypothetical protein